MIKPNAYIIGAGITGLSVGNKLSQNNYKVTLFERNNYIGGLSATFKKDSYLLDLGPHKIFSVMNDILEESKQLIGDDLLTIQKKSSIRLDGRYLNYPFGIKDMIFGLKPYLMVKCILSYCFACTRNLIIKKPDNSYKDWLTNRFGKVIFELIFAPYASKIWAAPDTLAKELAQTRVSVPSLFKMIKHMILGIKNKSEIMNAAKFYYAKYGSVTLANRLSEQIYKTNGNIFLEEEIVRITLSGDKIYSFSTGKDRQILLKEGDVLISTMPLKELKFKMSSLPEQVKTSIELLKTKNLILQYIIVDKPSILKDNWVFFPEKKYMFNRIFEQKLFSPYMITGNKSVLCLEITCNSTDAVWNKTNEEIFNDIIVQLEECNLVKRQDVSAYFSKRLEDVYQIYDIDYKFKKDIVFKFMDSIPNFYSIGRHGDFNYAGMLDCMDMGFKTADFIASDKKDRMVLRGYFNNYIVVD